MKRVMAVVLDRSFFSNLSKSSKILGVVLILGYLTVGLGPKDGTVSFALNTLALVAGKTLPFRCWNVVTSAFVENSAASVRSLIEVHCKIYWNVFVVRCW